MAREIVVLITTPSATDARKIGLALVRERLAACVNVVPRIESVFRWQDIICREREALMIVKTTARRFVKLQKRVQQLHRYTVPEVIALPIVTGSTDYLKWVREMTD